ncbi:MAG: hypothetical protein Q8O15_02795 [Rectinemataceae bacterium]|nr:hypothetical protein [Rectinemataceae bacterium]
MLITMIIVGGIVATTLIAALFDYLGKKAKNINPELENRIAILENRQNAMESSLLEKEEKLILLAKEVTFVNKLLDK